MDLKSKNVAVVGYGLEGKSAAAYALAKGASVTVCDANEKLNTNGLPAQLGELYLDQLSKFDVVFRSPSINPNLLTQAKYITSNTNWFLDNTSALTVGVTGSKGKGTTSTLIHLLAENLGLRSWLAGNVGKAVLDIMDDVKKDDVVVLELSSFQLIDAYVSPEIAVCLMIEPDHMNWHLNMNEYIDAKANITLHQNPDNLFIHHPSNVNVQKIVSKSPAQKIAFGQPPAAHIENDQLVFKGHVLMAIKEVGMIGKHNLENICAALTALESLADIKGIDLKAKLDDITTVIRNFKGLEHRLEFVKTINGVNYYNDTFAVMPDAAIAGLASFDQPIVAIIGGVDKKVELSHLAQALARRAKQVILIGEIADKMSELLDNEDFEAYKIIRGSMSEIVDYAAGVADAGDVVLLSPGSSSFDMFKDYKHRGKLFKEAVNEL